MRSMSSAIASGLLWLSPSRFINLVGRAFHPVSEGARGRGIAGPRPRHLGTSIQICVRRRGTGAAMTKLPVAGLTVRSPPSRHPQLLTQGKAKLAFTPEPLFVKVSRPIISADAAQDR